MKVAVRKEIKKNYIVVNKKKFRTNVGRAYPPHPIIKIPIITDIESVYVIFHEIAHIKLKHVNNNKKLTYIQEMEAEQYALRCLRKFSIHKMFPDDYKIIREKAIIYIIQNIYYDIEKGLKFKNICPKALTFCKQKQRIFTSVAAKKAPKKRKK